MLIVVPEFFVLETSAVYYVLCLLCDVSLVWLKVELVTASTILVGSVIFKAQTARVCRTIVGAQTKGVYVYLSKLRESVAIVVVRVAVTVALVYSNAV